MFILIKMAMSREEFEAQENLASTELPIEQPGGNVQVAVMTSESRERREEAIREQEERRREEEERRRKEEESERIFVSTEFARIAGVDTSFYTREYIDERRRQVNQFIINAAPLDGIEPSQTLSYAQLDLYHHRLNEQYFRDYASESDEVQSREATNQIINYLERGVPIRGDLPGVYVIANRFPNRFIWNLLQFEGMIESSENPEMNSVDKIINLCVKGENWEIVKRTLAGLRAERDRILRDEANTVEVRVGRLGRFMNSLKRRFR